jgi:hypothetical protein
MTRIFISHSHSDKAIAYKLVNFLLAALKLEEENIICTSNPDQGLSYKPSSITDQLKNQLKNSEALILLITADSLHSAWIPFEAGSFWTTDKTIIPILVPGLSQDDLPGPLKNFLSISIETQDSEDKLNNSINQLANDINVPQKVTQRRNDTLQEFCQHLRAWKSQVPDPDLSQQKQIEELTKKIEELERSHKKQLQEMERASQQEKQELVQQQKQLKEQLKYAKLTIFLELKSWEEADKETTKLMLQEVQVENRDYLLADEIKKIPCQNLQKINQLWTNYSGERFGFSVQKRIWNQVCIQSGGLKNYETYQRFGRRVGWLAEENSEWREWKQLTFNLENAPEGHLPGLSMFFKSSLFFVVGFDITDWGFSAFMKRIRVDMQIDLGAEKILAAERGEEKIAVEIKSFISSSNISEFHTALGQFLN